jgi:Sulfotransferase domain
MKTTIDFFVPGFSKCGTTTLFRMLNHHPELFIPEYKEPTYFGNCGSEKKTAWFDSLYAQAESGQKKGDCSTFYSSILMEVAASREMFENNPRAKLIFIARDPVERIESSFREMHNSAPKFGLNTPFRLEEALVEMPQILGDTSYYSRMKTHRDRFGEENVLVIFMEDMTADTAAVANRCYDFLGVGEHHFTREMLPHVNQGKEKLYDSRLFRWMRCNPVVGSRLSKISINQQDRIATRLGLRKPFTEPIQWSARAKSLVKEHLGPEIDAFLHDIGAVEGRWPKYQAL